MNTNCMSRKAIQNENTAYSTTTKKIKHARRIKQRKLLTVNDQITSLRVRKPISLKWRLQRFRIQFIEQVINLYKNIEIRTRS